MKCVICKVGEIKPSSIQTEIKVDRDRLLVTVQADACVDCGEPYYSADTMRYLENVRHGFVRKEFVPRLVGKVYEMR